MNIEPEYLTGLEDVAAQMRSIMDGSFVQDAIMPEPLPAIMERLVAHVEIIVRMYPDENLIRFADVANQGRAWILEGNR